MKLADNNVHVIKCTISDCAEPLVSEFYKKEILGEDYFDKLQSNMPIMEGLVTCPNTEDCNNQILFEKGEIDYNTKDRNNMKLARHYAENYAAQRVKCPQCKTEFCVDCKASPYHIGQTCQEYKDYQDSEKCRYCDTVIDSYTKGPYAEICNNGECLRLGSNACTEYLRCGHPCYGCKDETRHLGCLEGDCPDYNNIYNKTKSDSCEMCHDYYSNAPIVQADCGHMFHWHCMKTKLDFKWVGPKLIFTHIHCQTCKKELSLSNNKDLQELVNKDLKLFEQIKDMTLKRMRIEGLDKDPRIAEQGEFYKKPLEFGLFKISYHMCFKCKKPYFAGLRDCRGNENNVGEPDPSKYICENCSDLGLIPGLTSCKSHGKEFIAYKCKFCCSVSNWFCWGNTHFCEECHKRQCAGDYLSKYSQDKLPKCGGKRSCPLKIDHPASGQEFALGCTICANDKSNAKDY